MLILSRSRANALLPAADYFNRPYAHTGSAYYRPIGDGAIYSAEGSPETLSIREMCSIGLNAGSTCFPYGRPIYRVDSNSPRITVNRSTGYDDTYQGVPVSDVPFPAEGVSVLTPGHAGDDATLCFIDVDTGLIHTWRGCEPVGSGPPYHAINAGSYLTHWALPNGNLNVGKTAGTGHGLAFGDRVSQGAAGIGFPCGAVRGDELAGTDPIQHVFQISLPRGLSTHCANILSRNKVLPAIAVDGGATQSGNNLGFVDYGRIITVRDSLDLTQFGFTGLRMRLARAVQTYGILPLDGAAGAKSRGDQNVTATQKSDYVAVLTALRPFLVLVMNCAYDPNDRNKPAGGGTPLDTNPWFEVA